MKYISAQQLLEAIRQVAAFRNAANRQAAQHVLPFLSLRRKGVNTAEFTLYSEQDDYEFFDQHVRVSNTDDYPYFDPVACQMRIASHPHSNVATTRKGTFFRTWHAGAMSTDDDRTERWRLSQDYREIIRKKLTKAGQFTKIPAIPLAAILLRREPLPDDADLSDFGPRFRSHFGLSVADYDELFEGKTIPSGDFGLEPLADAAVVTAIAESGVLVSPAAAPAVFQELAIGMGDTILQEVRTLFHDGYAAVIFVGPPGTGKSWYAVQVALALADGDGARIRKIQFHKSFQYEQFVEGFVPNDTGTGFQLRKRMMLEVMDAADADRDGTYVVVIDELSRSDPGRVFGELLTYMEPSRRDETFLLASGTSVMVPPNVVFIGTMNSRDKGVSEIDDAFDRRVAKLEFAADPVALEKMLASNQVAEQLRRRVVAFLRWINKDKYPLGHTFFFAVRDEDGLRRLWRTQLRFLFEKAFRYDEDAMREIHEKFIEITGVDV